MIKGHYQALQKLANISLMPHQQLIRFQDHLTGLKSCFALIELDLQASPFCPHCSFKPVIESPPVSAEQTLNNLHGELDQLINNWTKTLLNNLEDPTIRANLNLLQPQARALIEDFLKHKVLPDEITKQFIDAIRELLSGLSKVTVKMDDLHRAMIKGGSPMKPEEMKKRLDSYLAELTKGMDQTTVRIILDDINKL